jgi:hypothetical protein
MRRCYQWQTQSESFGTTDTASSNTQRPPQTPDIGGNQPSPCDTPLPEAESSKVVYPEEFWHNQTPSDVSRNNCLARIRTYRTVPENQALALPDTQIDAQKLRDSSELIEIIRSWAALPEALKAGVLAIVRSGKGERK